MSNLPNTATGCEHCWPEQAEAAWQAFRSLKSDHILIDESHFQVDIRRCPHCSQRFLLIFTETIDWVAGNDPQSWCLLPISAEEAEQLITQADEPSERQLSQLGSGRRCLYHDFPSTGEQSSFWGNGAWIGRHD